MKRIDSLTPGTEVTLRFGREFQGDGSNDEPATFLRIEGEGDARYAYFDQGFEWAAYRYQGRWVYGSSAETLRLVEIHEEPTD